MSHNSKNEPGPTLDECIRQGITHLRVTCSKDHCRHENLFVVALMRARRDVRVTDLAFKCERLHGGCGGVGNAQSGKVTIGYITKKRAEPEPIPTIREIITAHRLSHLWCFCSSAAGCGSITNVPLSTLPPDLDMPMPTLRHPCPKCCGVNVDWRPDWSPLQPSHKLAGGTGR